MFTKILVANRGEIAIRAFRAAVRAGREDRRGVPVRGPQLPAPPEGRRGVPDRRAGASGARLPRRRRDHPRRRRVRRRRDLPGLRIPLREPRARRRRPPRPASPSSARRRTVLEMAGNKVTAKEHAIAAGVPVLRSTAGVATTSTSSSRRPTTSASRSSPRRSPAAAGAACAASTTHGRAARRALAEAMREADSAFGDPTMFLEQAVLRPRHIEVQILADATGETVHLFERDCSVQRRHQKVIEIAPAPNLSDDVRAGAATATPIAFAEVDRLRQRRHRRVPRSTPSGERAGEHVFIEMNPRIQVEHTVTEEVTDVDLVAVADPHRRGRDPRRPRPRTRSNIRLRGAALQCRITTEDPTPGFRPDTGKITTYRSPGRRRHPPRRRHDRRGRRRSARTSTRCSRS